MLSTSVVSPAMTATLPSWRSETRTATVSTNVSQAQIENLPQNDRNFLNFAALAPGVSVSPSAGNRRVQAGAVSSDNTNVFIDGLSLKNPINHGGVAGQNFSKGNPFPQSAVQEFKDFLPDVVTPAELPEDMNAFKAQQHRWAKGSIQTARKLLPMILKSDLPFAVKREAFFHLTNNMAYLLMVLLSALMPLSMVVRFQHGLYGTLFLDLPFFISATASVGVFYVAAPREQGAKGWARF